MEGRRRREGREAKDKAKKDAKEKDAKSGQVPKTTTAKLKERWLLTRKTWRYMSDAGKKLFPDGVNPQKTEDVPRVEEHFQKINNRNREFILWPQPQESPRTARRRRKRLTSVASDTTDTGDDYVSTDDEILAAGSDGKHRSHAAMGYGEGLEMGMGMGGGGIGMGMGMGATGGGMEMGMPGSFPGMMSIGGINYGTGTSAGPGTLPASAYPSLPASSMYGRERLPSVGELRYNLPPELYQHLLRSYGSCNLQHVASRLMEEQLTEEDEYDEDSGELLELGGITTRSVGAQTDPHLDMCVQTDDDATAEDMVKVGAECRSVTEAAAAAAQAEARALAQAQGLCQAQSQTSGTPETSTGSTSVLKKLWQRRESSANEQQALASAGGKDKKQASDKDREAPPPPPKGVVAAKLLWAEKAAAAQGGAILGLPAPKTQEKAPEKSKLKNVFKLGLKCDVDQASGSAKKSVEKTKIDRFKTVNYDKNLRNIKSKWVPGSEDDEEFMKQFQIKVKEEKKVKKKFKCIQVGEPLPQWILAGFRINSPVEIIHQRRLSRRRISKAESSDFSSSECSMSVPPSLPTSPRYSITVTDEMGTRDLLVSEAEAFRLSQMGAHIMYKRSSIDASVDTSEFEAEGAVGGVPPYQRSISALQASGHLSQMMYNLRGRPSHSQVIPGHGSAGSQGAHRGSQGLLQSFIPAVMQRTRSGGSGHASRLVAKKIWRARSKSQSRASAGTTSIWTPMGGNTWMSVTGRVVTLENTTLLQLTELERITLQQLAIAKLQALNLGCQIRVPREQTSSAVPKKRRPYLLKRKALTTGFFDSKKDETKEGVNSGLVFGLSLTKCVEIERSRNREAAERAAVAAAVAAAAAAASASSGTEETDPPLSRKSSHAGSQASFSSLIEGTKQSTTGSLESLNLERKRPSLVGGDLLPPGTTSPDLLTVEPSPQIPSLLNSCFKHLETNGMHTLGIFRVSSSKKRVRQLREEFDSGREVQLNEDHCPHDVATLLKEFFRDLPEPLLTRELYEPLIKTQKIRNRKLQFEALQHLIQLMPTANRDTLHSLLNFLTAVAENSTDQHTQTGETLQGNKMDSSNLATLFAPNILHMVKPGTETMSTTEMAVHAEERIEVINVVRTMIDHSNELFDVPCELLDETYQHIMDTHPEALDVLLRRRCTGPDDRGQHLQELLASLLAPHRPQSCPSNVLDLEIDTSSSVFEGSECSSSLPRSPTDATHHHDFDRIRMSLDEGDGARIRKREEVVHERAAVAQVEQSGRRRHTEEEDDGRGRRRDKGDQAAPSGGEDRGWFRKREKSSSRELDRTSEERQPEKSRWFRKRDKSSSRGSEEKSSSRREESDKKHRDKAKSKDDVTLQNSDRKKCVEVSSKKRTGSIEKGDGEEDRGEHRPRSSSEQTVNQERLRVPEPTVRRLSSPEIDNSGVITASLKIPVPLNQASVSLSRTHETEIPYADDSLTGGDKKKRYRASPNKDSGSQRSDMTRQRSGSSDSYLGQPITGSMSFQPLTKKSGDKQSHDSVLSSSSADVFTLSPSPRNTPLSDLYASGTSSPLSRTGSPPLWLSPDSGTPGLSPPNSPPPQPRRREDSRNNPIAHSVTHTFGSKPPSTPSKTRGTPTGTSHGLFPIGRSKTADSIKVESYPSDATVVSPEPESERANRKGSHTVETGREARGHREVSGKRYTRRRYTGERHPTGHLPDISGSSPHGETPSGGEGQTQLWKRWEIIASDPTEPETFV